ncbi:hypothetical protein SAMN05192556_1127 [Halomonas caseinilytica]|uniref:Uncharacterized protein n=1 Tax=Halomonas caseinilytica TaxID=438744 RepID=A0A1M7A332_9GAMM|nr:hypothetical protein SAMN05192556_1127 [Halomonas caseinilytica]
MPRATARTAHAPLAEIPANPAQRPPFTSDIGTLDFEHMTLTLDEDRHLRLVYYAACESHSRPFEDWLRLPISPG